MLSAPNHEASQTIRRPQMAVITPLHPICELASRASNGIEVALLWNRRSNELRVCVTDTHSGVYFELAAGRDNALDVFHHPYAYAASRRIAYGQDDAASTDTEQPLRLAA
jgi:hypothetical protein